MTAAEKLADAIVRYLDWQCRQLEVKEREKYRRRNKQEQREDCEAAA